MRIAVIGGGVSGLAAAHELAKAGVKVCLYEKEDEVGGHATAKNLTVDGVDLDLNLGFMAINPIAYPNMVELFESLGLELEDSDLSISVSLDKGMGCEWGSRNGLSSLFAQKSNVFNPYYWKMLHEIIKFKNDVQRYLDDLENSEGMDHNETLESFIKSKGYSELLQRAYIIPVCSLKWSCSAQQIMTFSAFVVLSFLRNHNMLQLFGRPQRLTIKGRSHRYVEKVLIELAEKGFEIRTKCKVHSISNADKGCILSLGDGSEDSYDGCILAVHPPDALKILGQQATFEERRILGAFQYGYSDIFLHEDKSLMPKNSAAWSAWNLSQSSNNEVSITYWLNVLQNIDEGDRNFFVTLNPSNVPRNVLHKWSARHHIPSVASSKASLEICNIQGKRGIWFIRAYQGYGFDADDDGLKAGMAAANDVLGDTPVTLEYPKQMVLSWTEFFSRNLISRFLRGYILTGCLIFIEDGGRILTFQGTNKICAEKVTIRVHNPQFYWKVSTEVDLGLADAYVNGDFSLMDKNEGLLNLFMVFIANRELKSSTSSGTNKKRAWQMPMLFTAVIASTKYCYRHILRKNTLTQARRNISRHYDLSNDMFSLFLDESMTYSCAVFKSVNEDLKDAQLRKIYMLIKKARIEKNHEVLEIGCGWGSLAIEVVRITGCKYTGITLSKEQLEFAQGRVKKVGLQDKIKFLLCDYRQLPREQKFDRIISCEMLEAVGHEYMEEFFHSCDSALAISGLLVLQFISIPDERYDVFKNSPDFMKEYIFPGGCLPSLSRVTSAMCNASKLCIEHIENIGIHYYQTLRCWRRNFLENQSKIIQLGFDEKFIRTWEYYFDYCAAGIKTRTLGDCQVVFSRPGNIAAFSNPYEDITSFSSSFIVLEL